MKQKHEKSVLYLRNTKSAITFALCKIKPTKDEGISKINKQL